MARNKYIRRISFPEQLTQFRQDLQPGASFVGPDHSLYDIVGLDALQNPDVQPHILNKAIAERMRHMIATDMGEDANTQVPPPIDEPFELQALRAGFRIKRRMK